MNAPTAPATDPVLPAPRRGLDRRALLGRTAAVAGLAGAATVLGGAAGARATEDDAVSLTAWDVGLLGDSLSSYGNSASGPTGRRDGGLVVFRPESYLGAALPLTQGRFRFGGSWATPGFTSAQALAVHLPEAVAARPTVCVILVGTNDINRLPVEESRANIAAIATGLQAAGITPVLATIPPKDNGGAGGPLFVHSLNTWIKAYARARSLPLLDVHAAVVDPATARNRAGLSRDGVHLSPKGASAVGRALAAVLAAVPGASPVSLLDCFTPHGALLTDVTHSIGTSWSLSGGATNGAYTRRSAPGWIGAKSVITSKTRNGFACLGRLGAQPTTGHRIQFATVLDVPTVPAGGAWSVVLMERVSGIVLCGYSGCTQPLTNATGNAVTLWEFDMPPLSPGAELIVAASVQGAVGVSVGLAQTTLLDLTSLGAAW